MQFILKIKKESIYSLKPEERFFFIYMQEFNSIKFSFSFLSAMPFLKENVLLHT